MVNLTLKRATPNEFFIFPFCEFPNYAEQTPWGIFADVDAMMRDLYDCGFNLTPHVPAYSNYK